MALGTAHVIMSHQIEATWTLPTKLQTRISNFTEAIPLTTLIIIYYTYFHITVLRNQSTLLQH